MSSVGNPDFDGCKRTCRTAGAHTLVWGDCAESPESARPEPRISIGPRRFTAADGELSVGFDTFTVGELAERIEKALRTVPVTLGPNALAMLGRDETVGLSGGEYWAMAMAVAADLAEPSG